MSTTTVTHHTGTSPGLAGLLTLGPRLMAASLSRVGTMVRAGSDLMAGNGTAGSHAGCCGIPETKCPPRCVCEINWRAAAGEHLKASIHFTNTSNQDRAFKFSVVPFAGPGNPQTQPVVSPSSAFLPAGKSVDIAVNFKPGPEYQAGHPYNGEILLQGSYEQAVCLSYVREEPATVQCHVEQGDPPFHVRAHQWYDHFQCSSLCFPASGKDATHPH